MYVYYIKIDQIARFLGLLDPYEPVEVILCSREGKIYYECSTDGICPELIDNDMLFEIE